MNLAPCGAGQYGLGAGDCLKRRYRGRTFPMPALHVHRGLPEPPASERCACAMAAGVAALLQPDVGLAITGGRSRPDEGHEPATVWVAVRTPMGTRSEQFQLGGTSPDEVCSLSCSHAVELARRTLLECSTWVERHLSSKYVRDRGAGAQPSESEAKWEA